MSSFRSRMLAAAAMTMLLFAAPMPASADSGSICRLPMNQAMIASCTEIIDRDASTPAERAEAMTRRGSAQMFLGNLDLALADFSALIAMTPVAARGYYLRATLHQRQDNHALALADYNKAIALDPNHALAFAGRGGVFQVMGDVAGALKNYDEAIRLAPEQSTLYNNRGLARQDSGDAKGAIADFSTAIRLDPKNALALVLRGNAYLARNEHGNALSDYEAALRLPSYRDMAYLGRAQIKFKRGDNDGAIADYTKVLELKPDSIHALVDRGISFARKGDFASSIPDYDAALKLKPGDADLRNRRAHSHFIVGQFAEAAADFGDVVAKSPEYGLARLLRYIARARSGDDDLGELKRNTDTFDRKAWPWPMAALYLGEMTQDEMLLRMKGIKLEDNFGDCGVSFYLGQYLMIHGKPQEALSYLKKATEVCRGDGDFERDAARGELKRQQASN